MENFTPLSALVGGLIIGASAIALLYFNGKICGISGIVEGLLPPYLSENFWKFYFLAGMLAGGASLNLFFPTAFAFASERSLFVMILAGFLVGFGARWGYGCTSGHGVCGVGRLSMRSLIATLTFLVSGIVTASVFALIGGAS